MHGNSENFNRRRFLKTEIGSIINSAGLESTFSATNYGPKKARGVETNPGTPDIIKLWEK